jgi:hypothetical protein
MRCPHYFGHHPHLANTANGILVSELEIRISIKINSNATFNETNKLG